MIGRDPRKMARHNVHSDRWDKAQWKDILKEMRSTERAYEELCEIAQDTGGSLSEDAFMQLFRFKPEWVPEQEIRPTHLINRAVEEEMVELSEYVDLRPLTVGDEIGAALAFEELEPKLEELYDRTKEAQKKAEQLEELMQEYLDQQEDDESTDEAMERLEEQIEEMERDLKDEIDGQRSAMRTALSEGLEAAQDQAEAVEGFMQSFGEDAGNLQAVPAEKRLEAARLLKDRPNLAKLAELVGPMSRLAFSERRRRVHEAAEEVYEVEFGSDLSQLTPDELVRFALDDMYDQFMVDYAEDNLLQYKLRGQESVGKGGIIACIDSSGSMQGDRDIYAKAIALSLANIAKREDREFKAVIFGSSNEIHSIDFEKPKDFTMEKLMEVASFGFYGGTSFESPLAASLKHLQKQHDQNGAIKGDIVFITDGMCSISDQFMGNFKDEQERLRFQVFGIGIGMSGHPEPLNELTDGNIVTLQNLVSGEPIANIFGELGRGR